MTRVGRTNNAQTTAPTNEPAMNADLLDRCFHFHSLKTLPSSYDASSAAVRIQFELYSVADENADAMQTHFSRKVRKRNLAGIELYAEQSVRKRLFDDSFHGFCGSHICVR